MHKTFRCPSFSETQKGSSTKCLGTVRQTNFDAKSRYTPLMRKIFRYLNFFETQKGSSTKCLGTVRQISFDGKSRYTLPPSSYL